MSIHAHATQEGSIMDQKHLESLGTAWLDLYTAALIELDGEKLKTLIDDVERAIAIRCMSLDPIQDSDEAQRLTAAQRRLSILRRESESRA